MLSISKFAKEIGVDSITFQKLRVEKFSPLKEIVENTPGYHISNKGILYSDTYSMKDLKKISRKIKLAPKSVKLYLEKLEKEELIIKKEHRIHKYPVYYANRDNDYFKFLKRIF